MLHRLPISPSSTFTILCLALLLATANPTRGQTVNVANDADVQAQIRLFSAWLEGQMAYRGLPGVVVGIVAGDNLVWAQAFGHADLASRQPMTTASRFRMASHSKLFTATAIMQLREQGLLRLDDPVVDYLPWFEVKSAEVGDPPITLEHLLTHSSGLPREAGSHWIDLQFPTAEELRDLLPERQAAFSPEQRWKYSNLAYTLAGMVVEQISGMSWSEYLQSNIFGPLEMLDSSVDIDDPLLASGYARRMPDGSRALMPFVDARGMAAATGLSSSVEDMAKFVSAQFRKGDREAERILSTASLREMHRVRMLETDWTRGQGIGFSVMRVEKRLYVGHGGGYPGYTTHTRIQLDDKVGVIVLTNTNDSRPSELSAQLMNTVGAAVAKASIQDTESVSWDPTWARFAGLYRTDWNDTHVVLMNERLVLINPNSRKLEAKVSLTPLGADRFLLAAPTGGGAVGEMVRFVEEDGRVTGMVSGDSRYDRVQ
ncbi:MAG: serine hydrolase domain-containing protein [Congregibacter sp.]